MARAFDLGIAEGLAKVVGDEHFVLQKLSEEKKISIRARSATYTEVSSTGSEIRAEEGGSEQDQ